MIKIDRIIVLAKGLLKLKYLNYTYLEMDLQKRNKENFSKTKEKMMKMLARAMIFNRKLNDHEKTHCK